MTETKPKKEDKKVFFRATPEEHTRLKTLAAINQTTMDKIVKDAVLGRIDLLGEVRRYAEFLAAATDQERRAADLRYKRSTDGTRITVVLKVK